MPMFALLEPEQSFASVVPSAAVHGLLIAAAIAASHEMIPPADPGPDLIDVSWTAPVSRLVKTTPQHELPLPGAPVIACLCTRIPPDLSKIEVAVPTFGVDARGLVGKDSIPRLVLPADPAFFGDQVWSESEVDDPPSLLTAGPLRYPQVLREAGITGSVTLAFIIDPEGRVEEQGMEVLSSSHPGFVAAATETIRASRFHPAKSHGEAVRVRVRQTVTFRD